MIWTEEILDQYAADGLIDIVNKVPCIFHRFYLATTSGTASYTLPAFVRTVSRITWRGIKVDEISWLELQNLMYQNEAGSIPYSTGTPKYYAHYPNNAKSIMFYPTPNATLLDSVGDPYKPIINEAVCTVSCLRHADDTNPKYTIPTYIGRRMLKAYVLSMAYTKEGVGQSLRASEYYSQLYSFLISYFILINDGVFVSKLRSLSGRISDRNGKPNRPRLPSQFGDVRYR